ncbi:transposase [Faecalicoccus pleomorphus]|uniref:transposase n=1 Tax=Faecalicoccus pleomorphus TaxID=1323 RepID=UPI001EF7409E|nr:transposase [Faecalicoccus pleomorphus]
MLRKRKNRYYSPELKLEIINKVSMEHRSINETAIEYGLSNHGILYNGMKSYKENGYTVVEK